MIRIFRVLAFVLVSTTVVGVNARAAEGPQVLSRGSQPNLAACVSETAIRYVNQTENWYTCEPGEIYRSFVFYQYPGGPACGEKYQFCNGTPSIVEGCQTQYFDQYFYGCQCA